VIARWMLKTAVRSELGRVISALIQRHRTLAASTDVTVRFQALWVAALPDRHLTQCSDLGIVELLNVVQERFGIFEAEFEGGFGLDGIRTV
jgi:hypothetical protein